MGFLLSHWHCILPVAAILIAMLFMREKPKDQGKQKANREQEYDIEIR